jgi:hypothetical protein
VAAGFGYNAGVRRWLFNLAAALSLLLCLASAVLWARSFYRWDLGQYFPRDGWAVSLSVHSGAGELCSSAEIPGISSYSSSDPAPPHAALWWFRVDFTYYPAWLVRVPLWFPVAASGAAAWWFGRRGRLAKIGICAPCGYDLRATPDRCPQCGKTGPQSSGVIANSASATSSDRL